MVDYNKEIERMVNDIKEENPEREVNFRENYVLVINGTKIDVSILEIKEPMEKDDEKTNINKMQILFKTKEGYVLIAEVNEDNEIMIYSEGIEKAKLNERILVTESDKIELREKTERERDENTEEKGDKEKDDEEKPELEEEKDADKNIEEIAKMYNVNSNQVIHISRDEKVDRDHSFDGIASHVRGYDDVYLIQGEDVYSWKTIGVKDEEMQEVESKASKQIGGKNPDITIKRIDGEEITEVKPLAMYEISSQESIAIVRNSFDEPEALYCRQESGDEKTYWGTIIPEASGKNVVQQSPETRDFISYKTNSERDLSEKGKELEVAEDREARGIPSEEKGIQRYEIEGTPQHNREKAKENIKEDLYKRMNIAEKMKGAMPGYLDYIEKQIDNKAEKILKLMEEDENITYEDAVEKVEKEAEREKGGKTPDENRKRGE